MVARSVVLEGDDPTFDDRLEIVPAAVFIAGTTVARVERIEGDYDAFVAMLGADDTTRVDDYGDRLVTPAFVNAHTHVNLSALRGSVGSAVARGNMVEGAVLPLGEQA